MNRQVRLKDVAEKCGVAVSTVSLILNGRSGYTSEATCRLVRETARALGYKQNFGYRLMRGNKTRTVVIMNSMRHMRFEEYITALTMNLMHGMEPAGYATYLSAFGNSAEDNLDKVHEFLARGVEYFILLGAPLGYGEIEKAVLDAGRLLTGTSDIFKRFVMVDAVAGAEQLMRHLLRISEGNMRLLLPSAICTPENGRCRALARIYPELGFDELCRRFIIRIPDIPENDSDFADASFEVGYKAVAQLPPDARAVVCPTDDFAYGAAIALREAGREVGKDLLLAGFNNSFAIRHYPLPISTVDHTWGKKWNVLLEASLTPGECRKVLAPEVIIRTPHTEI